MDIFDFILKIGSVLGAIGVICGFITKEISNNNFKKEVFDRLDNLNTNMSEQRKEYYRHELIDFLCDIENGIEKDEYQIIDAFSMYDAYKKCGGNSYLEAKWTTVIGNNSKENLIKKNKGKIIKMNGGF